MRRGFLSSLLVTLAVLWGEPTSFAAQPRGGITDLTLEIVATLENELDRRNLDVSPDARARLYRMVLHGVAETQRAPIPPRDTNNAVIALVDAMAEYAFPGPGGRKIVAPPTLNRLDLTEWRCTFYPFCEPPHPR